MSEPAKDGRRVGGGCLCGAVRFEVALPTLWCAHCHCTMCRKAHGAGFVTWIGVPYGQFRISAGEAVLTRYDSSDHGWRRFCSKCGSNMLCESKKHPEYIDVALGSLDGEIDRAPGAHVFVDDRASFVEITDELTQLGGKTGSEPRKRS